MSKLRIFDHARTVVAFKQSNAINREFDFFGRQEIIERDDY